MLADRDQRVSPEPGIALIGCTAFAAEISRAIAGADRVVNGAGNRAPRAATFSMHGLC